MAKVNEIEKLAGRRARLVSLINDLHEELVTVDREIERLNSEKEVRFDEAFFWERITPILANSDRALTGREMRERLQREGFRIHSSRFRVFLSRAGDRGYLSKHDEAGKSHPTWALTERARGLLNKLNSRRSENNGSAA